MPKRTDAQLDETVNALRARVGFNATLTNGFVTANGLNMQEEIRRERQVELMGECFRYTDLIRWKTAEKILPKALLGGKFTVNETNSGQQLAVDPTFTSRLTDATGKLNGIQEYDFILKPISMFTKSPATAVSILPRIITIRYQLSKLANPTKISYKTLDGANH